MVKVLVPRGLEPIQVDDFGPGVERTVTGALYLRPGSVHVLTDSEWQWLLQSRPLFASRVLILEDTRTVAAPPPAPAPEPPVETTVDEAVSEPEPVTEDPIPPAEDSTPATADPAPDEPRKRKKRKRKKKQ